MWQTTPGTLGSSKSLTQTLSLGESRLKVVLTQARSSARARPGEAMLAKTSRIGSVARNASLNRNSILSLHRRAPEDCRRLPSNGRAGPEFEVPAKRRSRICFTPALPTPLMGAGWGYGMDTFRESCRLFCFFLPLPLKAGQLHLGAPTSLLPSFPRQ